MSEGSHRSYARAISALAGDPREGHPGPDRLVAYQRGELDGIGEEAVREHLTGCPDCTALVLDLVAFADADAGESGPVDFETAAAWRAFLPHLETKGDPARPGRLPWHPAWLAAAALALVSLGLGVHALRLAGEGSIEADLPILYLDQAIRGDTGSDGPTVDLGLDGYLALVVLPPPEHAGEALAARLTADRPKGAVEDEAREVWHGVLTPSPEGGLRLGLPASVLAPGAYRLRLYPEGEAEHGPPVAEHRFSITRR